MSPRGRAEKPEQPLRLSWRRFGFWDRALKGRQHTSTLHGHFYGIKTEKAKLKDPSSHALNLPFPDINKHTRILKCNVFIVLQTAHFPAGNMMSPLAL